MTQRRQIADIPSYDNDIQIIPDIIERQTVENVSRKECHETKYKVTEYQNL